MRHVQQELLHVPRAGRAALGAQPAVQADVLVLGHNAAGLKGVRDIEVLGEGRSRRVQAAAQVGLLAVVRERDAVHRTDVHAGIALDAELGGEHRLHVAIEAALRLRKAGLRIEAHLDFDLDVLQRHLLVAPRHLVAGGERDVVVVAPLVDAHLLRYQVYGRRRTLRHVLAVAQLVDRDRRVVAVRDRPDDVLGAERRVTAEEHVRQGGLHGGLVHHRHAAIVELDAGVALDPGEGVFLSHRDQHVVALEHLVGLAGGHQVAPAFVVVLGLDLLERHPGQLAVGVQERSRDEVVEDGNALVLGVFLLPGRRFHLFVTGAHDDLHVVTAEAARGAAAVHRGVAAAEDDDSLADLVDVAEGHRRQPVDADMDVGRGFLAAGNLEVAPARGAAADEYRVVALAQQLLQAVDAGAAPELDAQIEDVAHFLVDDLHRQAEARNLRPDHAASAGVLVEHGDVIAERREVASHGERCGAGADAGDALAVSLLRLGGQPVADVFLVVGGDALQPADRDRLGFFGIALFDATAAARGIAGPGKGASENSGKHYGVPVDHVGIAVATRGDQPDIFGDWSVGRAGPLAIDDFMEVVGGPDIGRLQSSSLVLVLVFASTVRPHCPMTAAPSTLREILLLSCRFEKGFLPRTYVRCSAR